MTTPLVPRLTLADVYGPGHIYVPALHPACTRWMPDLAYCDLLTGGQLAISGAMPILCSAGVTTPDALELLEDAGLEPAPHVRTYRGCGDMETTVRELVGDGWTLVLQHAFPSGALPDGSTWIAPGLQAFLNNKAHLAALAPAAAVPRRELVEPAAIFGSPPSAPFVLKVATDLPNGGGFGVSICRQAGDVTQAAEALRSASRLVLEEWLQIATNLCVHFAVGAGGTVHYLGSACQQVDAAGRYRGNWIPAQDPAPAAAVEVGAAVVRSAASMGYYGWVGIDMVVLEDGSVRALDLNFRVNSSTTAILLADALRSRHPGALMRYRSWQFQGGTRELAGHVRDWVRDGRLVPLCLFDAEAAGHPGKPARISAILLGEDRADIEAAEARLMVQGLS